ncbi:ATP-binding protein [Rubritalea sp.]
MVRALNIKEAGSHNMLMGDPPAAGKSMLSCSVGSLEEAD